MLILRVEPPRGETYRVPVETLPIKLGRSLRSDLRLDDPYASRLHAELRTAADGYLLNDLSSGNGTLVNGRRVGDQVALAAGDRIRIGNTLITVETDAPRPGVTAAVSGGPAIPLGPASPPIPPRRNASPRWSPRCARPRRAAPAAASTASACSR